MASPIRQLRDQVGTLTRRARPNAAVKASAGNTAEREMELKFAADHVEIDAFCKWAQSLRPVREHTAEGMDDFYRRRRFLRPTDVRRHRYGSDLHEVTEKQNVKKGTRERYERDEAQTDSPEAVKARLLAKRYREDVGIKKVGFMFDVVDGGVKVDLSIYEATGVSGRAVAAGKRRFIEVEVEKRDDVSTEVGDALLDRWAPILQRQFGLGEPMSDSLYKLMNGKGYRGESKRSLKPGA